jgi:hypothetical protein
VHQFGKGIEDRRLVCRLLPRPRSTFMGDRVESTDGEHMDASKIYWNTRVFWKAGTTFRIRERKRLSGVGAWKMRYNYPANE